MAEEEKVEEKTEEKKEEKKKKMTWLERKKLKKRQDVMKEEGVGMTVKEKVDSIYKYFEKAEKGKQEKKKNLKLPAKVKRLTKKTEKDKVIGLYLKRNRTIEPIVAQMKHGFLTIGDYFYDGNPKYIWFWKGKSPVVVVPEWDLYPLSASELFDRTTENNTPSDPARLIVRAMKSSEIKGLGAGMGGFKTWIWIGLGILVVLYIAFG